MPPLVQSAHWQTLARQAGRLLTRVKPPNINTIKTNLPRKVARVIRQSFPSLNTPAHLLELNPAYAFTSSAPNQLSRGFNKAVTLNRLQQPFAQASRGIRTAARRPSVPFASNVGLGSARLYSAGPQQAFHGKVPMALRALASLIDKDTEKTLPTAGHYKPYDRRQSKRAKRSPRLSFISIDSEKMNREAEYAAYFHPRAAPVAAANLLVPEKLVTAGVTTILSIAIADSYRAIFDDFPVEDFDPSQLGIGINPGVFDERVKSALVDIMFNPGSRYIMGLLSKLDSLGVSRVIAEGDFARFEMDLEYDRLNGGDIRPAELQLIFHDRCKADVLRIIGESLRPEREGWLLREERVVRVVSSEEALAALEAWADTQRPARPRPIDNRDLIMPVIDLDELNHRDNDLLAHNDAAVWSGMNSGSTTPESLLDDDPDDGMSDISVMSDYVVMDHMHVQLQGVRNEWDD